MAHVHVITMPKPPFARVPVGKETPKRVEALYCAYVQDLEGTLRGGVLEEKLSMDVPHRTHFC